MPQESEIFTREGILLPYLSAKQHLAKCTQDLTTMRSAVYINGTQLVFLVAQVFTGLERDNESMHKTSE